MNNIHLLNERLLDEKTVQELRELNDAIRAQIVEIEMKKSQLAGARKEYDKRVKALMDRIDHLNQHEIPFDSDGIPPPPPDTDDNADIDADADTDDGPEQEQPVEQPKPGRRGRRAAQKA